VFLKRSLFWSSLCRRRAFVFTVDALLALALVSSLFIVFALTAPQPSRAQKYFELEQLGFDSLALQHDDYAPQAVSGADFEKLTGLHRFDSPPKDAAVAVRARYYHYPALCGCAPPLTSCTVSRSDYCLNSSDAGLGVYGGNHSEVWVTP
jgi:hypothetical protein